MRSDIKRKIVGEVICFTQCPHRKEGLCSRDGVELDSVEGTNFYHRPKTCTYSHIEYEQAIIGE